MSINAIMGAALSGLQASQAGLRTTSNNISNVNTPGYARQDVALSARVLAGEAAGVDVNGVYRVTDQYLTAASLQAAATSKLNETVYEVLDRAQSAFGDPTSEGSVFGQLNSLFASFAEAASDPASPVRRSSALADLEGTLAEFSRISDEIQNLRAETDGRIATSVEQVNSLLQDVVNLNLSVQRGAIYGDSTGSENALSQVLDELSELIDIRTVTRSDGTIEVRTQDGTLLAGRTAATLTYHAGGVAAPGRSYAPITITIDGAAPTFLDSHISGGELRGLLDLRDQDLPELALQVGEFAAKTADALNRAHADGVAYPAPEVATGRNTGLIASDAHGFSGVARIAVAGADGTYAQQIDIDFDAGVITRNGVAVAATGATVGSLASALDTALGGIGGSAIFAGGALTLTAPSGAGLAFIQEPLGPATVAEPDGAALAPSDRAGRGFAHFFGLNDLVESNAPLFYETGLSGAGAHGFTAGETIDFRLTGADGARLADVTYTVSGSSLDDVITGLNASLSGFGTFALDAQGELSFTAAAGYDDVSVSVLDDATQRGATGLSFTELFGFGDGARAGRASDVAVRSDIAADPARLGFGKFTTSDRSEFAATDVVFGAGDAGGAQALQAAGETPISFDAAGALSAVTVSVIDYAGRVASDAGHRASAAERSSAAADALRTEADARRSSVEGVNIDEELIRMTSFQQAYNASTRLIQAAKEMTDALLSLV